MIKLYTTTALTKGQLDEYSALHIIPEGGLRDARMSAFRQELINADVEALLTTGDDVGVGTLVEPIASTAYGIFYNYEWVVDVVRVYGRRELHRELHSSFILDGYYMEETEDLTQDDIDNGTDLLWTLIDKSYTENKNWLGYYINELND